MPDSRRAKQQRRQKAVKGIEQLAVPLSPKQIRAAVKLHDLVEMWKTSDRALRRLAMEWPGFGPEECLLKAIAVNSLYVTRILVISRMAAHIHNVMRRTPRKSGNCKIVDNIADLGHPAESGSKRRYLSFASKFAHVFIDPKTIPILDKYAVQTLRRHLGRGNYQWDGKGDFEAYVEDVQRVRAGSGWRGSIHDLDHYLWIAGQRHVFKNNRSAQINNDLRRLFTTSSPTVRRLLKVLDGP